MSSLRNAVPSPAHKERPQPSSRKKFGLLEKHKDCVERAKAFHKKEEALQKLRVKAANRNEDEFSFKMIRAKIVDGVHKPDKLVLRIKLNEGMKRSLRQTKSGKEPKAKQKKNRQKIDSKKPKKPPTAFFYFLEDFRKEFQEQNPDVKSMRDVGKACGEKWKTMTYEEKVQYYDIATEKRAEFDRATAEYNKRMESGEYELTDESEFDE